MAGGVRQLVEGGAVVLLGLGEELGAGKIHRVGRRPVKSPWRGVDDFRPLRHGLDDARRCLDGREVEIDGLWRIRGLDAIYLVQAENGVVAQDRYVLFGLGLAVLDLVSFPEDHRGAFLPFADMAAALLGLLEGEPVPAGAPHGHEQEHIDAAIFSFAGQVHREFGRLVAIPWLVPRDGALFEHGDDAVGDHFIDVELSGHGSLLKQQEPPGCFPTALTVALSCKF